MSPLDAPYICSLSQLCRLEFLNKHDQQFANNGWMEKTLHSRSFVFVQFGVTRCSSWGTCLLQLPAFIQEVLVARQDDLCTEDILLASDPCVGHVWLCTNNGILSLSLIKNNLKSSLIQLLPALDSWIEFGAFRRVDQSKFKNSTYWVWVEGSIVVPNRYCLGSLVDSLFSLCWFPS